MNTKTNGLLRRRLDRRCRRAERDFGSPRLLRAVFERLFLRPKKAIPHPVLIYLTNQHQNGGLARATHQ